MQNLSMKRIISLFSVLSLTLTLTLGQSGLFLAKAAETELGTQAPAITASYTDSEGNPCDGNALSAGNYTMALSVSDLASISELEFTASYDSDILSFSLLGSTMLSDTLPQLDGIGPLVTGGSFIFGLMSENEDKTLLPDNGAQLISIGLTVTSENPVDMNEALVVNADPLFTFIEVDFGDAHQTETGWVYDCYALSSPSGFSGTVYPMTCDLSPDITQYYNVSAYIGALASPEDEYGSYATTGATVTVSTEKGDISAVTDENGRFTLENVPNGEYTATVTYKYGFSREFTVIVNGADIDSKTMVGIVACDFNASGTITVADFNIYNQAVNTVSDDVNYDLGIDLNRSDTITVADYNIYSNFINISSGEMDYFNIILE